jgi:hypothetical protein
MHVPRNAKWFDKFRKVDVNFAKDLKTWWLSLCL